MSLQKVSLVESPHNQTKFSHLLAMFIALILGRMRSCHKLMWYKHTHHLIRKCPLTREGIFIIGSFPAESFHGPCIIILYQKTLIYLKKFILIYDAHMRAAIWINEKSTPLSQLMYAFDNYYSHIEIQVVWFYVEKAHATWDKIE